MKKELSLEEINTLNLLSVKNTNTKIKICGLFRECDADYVNLAIPDYAGFVFYKLSRRGITEKQALGLRKRMDPKIQTVGVFVDESIDFITKLCEKKIISIIQLHGSENESYIKILRSKLPNVEIWKTYQIKTTKELELAKNSSADRVLLDNGYGTGECFDWSILKSFSREFILAGGLNQRNIGQAILEFNPYAVDISSGVESEGKKDKDKIQSVVSTVRG